MPSRSLFWLFSLFLSIQNLIHSLGELIAIAGFMTEVKVAMAFEALSRKCDFTVTVVGIGLAVEADRHLLLSAVSNLLQNAFKFTHPGTRVNLSAYVEGNKLLIDI